MTWKSKQILVTNSWVPFAMVSGIGYLTMAPIGHKGRCISIYELAVIIISKFPNAVCDRLIVSLQIIYSWYLYNWHTVNARDAGLVMFNRNVRWGSCTLSFLSRVEIQLVETNVEALSPGIISNCSGTVRLWWVTSGIFFNVCMHRLVPEAELR